MNYVWEKEEEGGKKRERDRERKREAEKEGEGENFGDGFISWECGDREQVVYSYNNVSPNLTQWSMGSD